MMSHRILLIYIKNLMLDNYILYVPNLTMYKTIMHYLFLMVAYALFYSHFHIRSLGQIFFYYLITNCKILESREKIKFNF